MNLYRQIATACGPCGNNKDYIFLLEKAMYDIGKLFIILVFNYGTQYKSSLCMCMCMLMGWEFSCVGHEDDLVIELANEVRKVLAILGNVQPKNKKLVER